MQRRPVDLLRGPVEGAIALHPHDGGLPVLLALVAALEQLLFPPPRPEAEAALLASSSSWAWLNLDFQLLLSIVILQTGSLDLFERFFAKYVDTLAGHDDVALAWRDLAARIDETCDADALDPSFAEENARAWLRAARAVTEAKGTGPDDKLLPLMDTAYRACARAILLNLQGMMDRGLSEVANGGLPIMLRDLQTMVPDLVDLEPAVLPVTRVDGRGTAQAFVDSFPRFTSRRFEAMQFDSTSSNPLIAKPGALHEVLNARARQLDLVLELFGQPRDPRAKPSSAELQRQTMLRNVSRPISFSDHDDFVRLLSAIFVDRFQAGGSGGDAMLSSWEAALDLIDDYLNRFTVHSGYDLSDAGPNYLTTPFPRSIAGEQLHDCAVYAALVAYWVLNLELALRRHGIILSLSATFLSLPAHVGLIVALAPAVLPGRSDGLPSGGLLVTHNAHVHWVGADELGPLRTKWGNDIRPGERDPPDMAGRNLKFMEDLAASKYIENVDMPIVGKQVLRPKQAPTRSNLWASVSEFIKKFGSGEIWARRVYLGAGDFSQYYLQYLALLTARADFFNKDLAREFWRERAPAVFQDAIGPLDQWKEGIPPERVDRYGTQLNALIAEYTARITQFLASQADARSAIDDDLEKHRKNILSRSARMAFSERLTSAMSDDLKKPLDLVAAHVRACQAYAAGKRGGPRADLPYPPFLAYAISDLIL